MTTIGKQWLRAQQEGLVRTREAAAAALAEAQRAQAEEIIGRISGLIAKAGGHEESVRVYGWISSTDVSGTDSDKVDKLMERLREEGRPLRASDLAGTAAIVFAWCDVNDLECFLVPVDIQMNEDEYDFCVRPKK